MKKNLLLILLIVLLPKVHAQQIAAYGSHSMYLSEEKELWVWGNNNHGQLGTGNVANLSTPTRLELDFDIAEIHAGTFSSIALSTNGEIWGWGSNISGQIGLGETSEFHTPTLLELPAKIQKLSIGNMYALALTLDGALWGWGYNYKDNRLGIEDVFYQKTPVKLHPEFIWKEVSAGVFTSAGIRDDGTLWAWGSNIGFLLGSTDYALGESASPMLISNETDWAKVALANRKGFALKTDSTLWTWGRNDIGDTTPLNGLEPFYSKLKWKNVKCVGVECTFLDEFDRAWQLSGEELLPLEQKGWVQVILNSNYNIGLQSNGEVYTWGWNYAGGLGIGISGFKEQPQKLDLQIPIKSIDLEMGSVMAIGEDNSLYSWGTQSLERLFLPDSAELRLPLKINRRGLQQISSSSNRAAIGIQENGELYAWGNFYGWNEVPGLTQIEETKISEDTGWVDVQATVSHSLMLKEDGSVFIIGNQGSGSDLHFRKFSEEPVWDKISVGDKYSILLKNDGTLWGIGGNNFGQLGIAGLDNTEELILLDDRQSYRNLKDISSSSTHTLVVREDGTLWGWGHNIGKHLANTDNNFLTPFPLDTASDWKKVSAGMYGSLFLKKDGSLWAAGDNIFDESQKDAADPSRIVQVGTDRDWKFIAAGGSSNAAIKEDGSIWTWGNAFNGVLGSPDAFRDEYQLVKFQEEEDEPQEIFPPIFGEQIELEEITLGIIKAQAEIIAAGGSPIVERGFVYARDREPFFADQIIASGSGTGVFQSEIMGLQPNATYHFKAFAINQIADTVLTETFTITTAIRLPEVVINPVTTLDIVSALASAEVTASGGAEVQEKGFVWSLEDQPDMEDHVWRSGGDGGSFSAGIAELAPGTIYFIRAFATNVRGTTFSETVSFQTLYDTLAPAFEGFEAEPVFRVGGESYAFGISLSDHSEIKQLHVRYRGIRTPDLEENWKISDNLINAHARDVDSTYYIGEEHLDELGMTFYVVATDVNGNTSKTEIQYVYRAYGEENPLKYTLPHAGVDVKDYRLFGVPLALGDPTIGNTLAKDFHNVHSAFWRVFGLPSGEMVELNDSHSLTLGKAYWLISALNQPLHFTGTVAQVDHLDPFVFELEPGWNMLSNPYPFVRNWEYILSHNKHIEGLPSPVAFDGEYKEEKVLRPFEGVFVFASERQSLKVPIGYETAPSQRLGKHRQGKDWILNFRLATQNGPSFNLSGLGMSENASEGFDRCDLPLLPRLAKYVDLHFTDKNVVNVPITKDMVSLEENYQWEFVVNSSEREISLSWSFENIGDGGLWLLDVEKKERIDMRKMTMVKAQNGSRFKVIYGAKYSEISGFISGLLSPYPNPATSTVSIPYTLMGSIPYEIKIYDSSGRLVEVVEQGTKDAGIYVKIYPVGQLSKGVYHIVFTSYEGLVPLRKAKPLIIK